MKIDYQVAIVGAGVGGIIAALNLKNSNRNSFIIFEKANELGGVWRDNTYPGCTCDVKSNLYSIASERNPDWSSSFAGQAEIFQYLKDVAAKHNLWNYISYGTLITEMNFIEEMGCWEVIDQDAKSYMVKMVILATGPINRPDLPAFTGQETFKGKTFHSSQWDSTYDLAGKKVAVLGTGASAIQIVPNIAPLVSKLFVFQRTPAWILPRGQAKNRAFKRWLYRNFPIIQKFNRELIYWLSEFVVGSSLLGNSSIHSFLKKVAIKKLKKEVNDPVTRQKLTPKYEMGCKRILVSDDFYQTFNRPNVELVTENISEMTSDGIRTADGQVYEADAIVFATGFVVADIENYIKIAGRNGHVLTDDYDQNGAEAYLGTNVNNYPNLAILLGPNTGLGHNSVMHMMESQISYIIDYLAYIERNGEKSYLDIKPDAQKKYNEDLQKKLEHTVWSSGCKSWYFNRKGKNTAIYPGLASQYRRKTQKLDITQYDIGNKLME